MQNKKKHHILFSKDNSLKHRERIGKLLKKYPFSLNLRYKYTELEALQKNYIAPEKFSQLATYAIDRQFLKNKFKKLNRKNESLWKTKAEQSIEKTQNLPKESLQNDQKFKIDLDSASEDNNLPGENPVKQHVNAQNKMMAPKKRDNELENQAPHVIQFNDWLEGLKKSKKSDDLAYGQLKGKEVKKKKKKKKRKDKKKKLSKKASRKSPSEQEEKDIISETLAELMAKQGYTDKAIEMYNRLSLLFPDKNSYFARKIKDLNK